MSTCMQICLVTVFTTDIFLWVKCETQFHKLEDVQSIKHVRKFSKIMNVMQIVISHVTVCGHLGFYISLSSWRVFKLLFLTQHWNTLEASGENWQGMNTCDTTTPHHTTQKTLMAPCLGQSIFLFFYFLGLHVCQKVWILLAHECYINMSYIKNLPWIKFVTQLLKRQWITS